MARTPLFRRPLLALPLGLGLVAACSTPPSTPTPTESAAPAAPAAEAAAPGSGGAAPVAAPSTPAAPQQFSGVATFQKEALVGYKLHVINARSGEEVPVVADLAGAKELAVKLASPTTDATGHFAFEVANFIEGETLIVQVTKEDAALETIVLPDGTTFGSKPAAYRTAQTRDQLTVDEVNTALASIARNVIRNMYTMPTSEYAAISNLILLRLRSMSDRLLVAMIKDPKSTRRIISRGSDGGSTELNFALAQVLNAAVLRSDVAATIQGTIRTVIKRTLKKFDYKYPAPASPLPLYGTELQAGAGPDGSLQLQNQTTGAIVSPDADVETYINTTRKSGSSSGTPPAPTPTPKPEFFQDISVDVATTPSDVIDGYRVTFKLAGGIMDAADKVHVELRKGALPLASTTMDNVAIPAEGKRMSAPFDIDTHPEEIEGWKSPLWLGLASAVPTTLKLWVEKHNNNWEKTVTVTINGDPHSLYREATGFFADGGAPTLADNQTTFTLKPEVLSTIIQYNIKFYKFGSTAPDHTITVRREVVDGVEQMLPSTYTGTMPGPGTATTVEIEFGANDNNVYRALKTNT